MSHLSRLFCGRKAASILLTIFILVGSSGSAFRNLPWLQHLFDSTPKHEDPSSSEKQSSTVGVGFVDCTVDDCTKEQKNIPSYYTVTTSRPLYDASTDFSIPLRPIQRFRLYAEQHSQQALTTEASKAVATLLESRKFAVAYYWCPQRAGNIFHSFFNSVTWAMIHNRTILWAYQTTIPSQNQEKDCQEILKRAEWLPSYQEWKQRLNLPDPVPVSNSVSSMEQNQIHQVVLYPQIPDVLFGQDDSMPITRNKWSDHPLRTKASREYLQALPETFQNITHDLFAERVEFLYGMLFLNLFQLQQQTGLNVSAPPSSYPHSKASVSKQNTYSIGLHSRHIVEEDDGSFINQEQDCLVKLLKTNSQNNTERPCHVYLMSDRPKTIELLTNWLTHQQNCSVVTATHDTGEGPRKEHGPWAGVGFLEDLLVTSQAQDSIVGDLHRSSTALLIELATYRRKVAAWNSNISMEELGSLELCKLPERRSSGYNYGPGTPTFRDSHSRQMHQD